jgi:DNA polymerase III psi subunit
VYLDDVIFIDQTVQLLTDNLQVFQSFQESCLKCNPELFVILQKKVQYLGHTSLKGVTTDPQKLKAAQCWTPPWVKHKLQSILGSNAYYKRFNVGFPDITKQLTQIPQEKWSSQWFLQEEAPFQSLTESMHTAPILGYLWLRSLLTQVNTT